MIGYYLLLIMIFIPTLSNGGETYLSEISRRSRAWLYLSLGVFLLTGFYLMLVDANYMGIGKFNNPWSILMLVKHLLILGMIGIGFWVNMIWRAGQRLRTDEKPLKPNSQKPSRAKCGVRYSLFSISPFPYSLIK